MSDTAIYTKGFQSELEKSLGVAIKEVLFESENILRSKRRIVREDSATIVQKADSVRVEIQQVERLVYMNDSVKIRFNITIDNGTDDDLTLIAHKLNNYTRAIKLNDELNYKIVSEVNVRRRAPHISFIIDSFIIIPFGILIIFTSLLIVYWLAFAKMVTDHVEL